MQEYLAATNPLAEFMMQRVEDGEGEHIHVSKLRKQHYVPWMQANYPRETVLNQTKFSEALRNLGLTIDKNVKVGGIPQAGLRNKRVKEE